MAILLDSGFLYANLDRSDRWHGVSAAMIEAELGGLLLPTAVIPKGRPPARRTARA